MSNNNRRAALARAGRALQELGGALLELAGDETEPAPAPAPAPQPITPERQAEIDRLVVKDLKARGIHRR